MTRPLEIERTYLLDGMPPLPAGAAAIRLEQGYLPPVEGDDPLREGRLRRIVHADGRTDHRHTIKRGAGLVREETERPISEAEFEAAWPRTEGRRIVKVRHQVREGDLTWEIDVFESIDLVLAEVELPRADSDAPIPAWLAPHIVREVTDEPEYRNYALATRHLRARS